MTLFFAFGLWQAASTVVCKHRKLDETSEILRRYHAAVGQFLDPYVDFEENLRWLCEMNSFANDRIFQETEDDKVTCGCPENPCRRNQRYNEQRFGENKDRRWAIYERESRFGETATHYEKSRECISTMQVLLMEIYYVHKTYLTIIAAVIFLVIITFVYCAHEKNNLKESLKKAIEEQKRLRKKLSEKEMFHNIQETSYELN